MNLKHVVSVVLAMSPFLLSGCGGSSSSNPTANKGIEIAPSLGKISLATVYLYQSDGTTLLSSSEIGSDGLIKISYSGSYSGPIIVVVKGDSDATYFDESTGTELSFGAGKMLRAIVPGGTTETAVTMLTEIAYQLSLTNSIPLTNTSVNLLNERVRAAIAPELTSITVPPLLFDSATTAGDLDNTHAGKYALRLAALADLGSSDATPALKIAEQMAWDFADGILDGQGGGSAISGLLYNHTTIAADLTTKLSGFANSYGSIALQTALSNYSTITTNVNVSDLISGGTGGTGTLPSYVSGKIVTMKYGSAATGSPYSEDEEVLFSFSSSGMLMLTEDYTEVSSSFTLRGSEYIWVDSDNSIEYALSVHNDAIHEVNVTGIGGTPFYGQFTLVEETPDGETLVPDGDGSALSGLNGATGTIGSTSYTYSHPLDGDVLYTYAPLTDAGVFISINGSDAITRWQIGGFTNSVGRIYCNTDDGIPSIMLTISGTPNLASECVIDVISVSPTEIEGQFAATFNGLGTVTNGYFRYEVPQETSTGGLADGEYGYSMDVDGENVTNSSVLALDKWDIPVADYITLGDTPNFKLNLIPENTTGTYTCGQGPNSFRLVSMSYGLSGAYVSDNATYPGTCTIEVTSAGDLYEGTFTGTLYNSTGTKMEITNGVFRNDGSTLHEVTNGGGAITPILDVNDTTFQTAADTALSSYGATSGSGAIYMDIQDNDESGGSHYWDETFTMATASISSFNGALVFKSGSFMANTIGLKNILNETSGDVDCVDNVDDVGTSDYDVFGYKAYIAPNTLKPYSNDSDSCTLNVQYDAVSEKYTGQGAAKVHYYDNGDATYYIRDLRFKFVYKP